jgi:hypothetical protein
MELMSSLPSMIILMSIVVAAVFFMYVMLLAMKSDRVIVRLPKNKGSLIEGVYWTIPKPDTRTGVEYWESVFWQKKLRMIKPPPEAIDYGKKGKKFVEVYRMSEDEFIYINDSGITEATIFTKNNVRVMESLKAFSSVQREVIVSQFEKSKAENPTSFLREHGMNLAMAGMMFVIIIVGIMYFGDIMGNVNTANASSASLLQEVQRTATAFGLGNGQTSQTITSSNTDGGYLVQGSEAYPEGNK